MAYGDKWKAKVILDLEITTYNADRAQRKWETTLEKLKYQVTDLKITQSLEPNWQKDEEEDAVAD